MKNRTDRVPRVPLAVVVVAFGGAAAALVGGYWDDAWHTERGRDEFFIAPHIAIYAGVAAAGAALSWWALLAARTHGSATLWRHRPLTLALVSVVATLLSGPIDNAWHEAFGRDAVIWSPPHMLGIAGTLALGAALLAELSARPERWAQPLATLAGALVLAAAGFATVEYDTDVPQFDVAFYLPVLGLAATIGLLLVRLACAGRWAATAAAAVYTGFIAAVGAFLALVGFPPPALPLVVVAAIAVDVAARRRWPPALAGAAVAVALHAAYVPVRNVLGDGVRFDLTDVALGLPLTWLASTVVFAMGAGARLPPLPGSRAAGPAAAALVLALVLVLASAPRASAHDPGQGDEAGTVGLTVAVTDMRAHLTVDVPRTVCAETEPVAVVARRGGRTLRAPLTRSGCRLEGSVRLPSRGRWFVYAEMRRGGSRVESWLPVSVGAGRTTVSDEDRYAYVAEKPSGTVVKVISGVVLYAAMLALLYATFALVGAARRNARGPAASARPA